MAAKGLAGEERNRTMGVLLASPITRRRVVLEKAAAIAIMVIATSAATMAGTLVGIWIAGLELSVVNLLAASVHLAAWGLFIGAVALALSAATGRSAVATGGATGLFVVAYATASFLPVDPDLADWARLSPFYYYVNASVQPMVNGAHWGNISVLVAAAALLTAASVWLFNRRDLRG